MSSRRAQSSCRAQHVHFRTIAPRQDALTRYFWPPKRSRFVYLFLAFRTGPLVEPGGADEAARPAVSERVSAVRIRGWKPPRAATSSRNNIKPQSNVSPRFLKNVLLLVFLLTEMASFKAVPLAWFVITAVIVVRFFAHVFKSLKRPDYMYLLVLNIPIK